MIGHIIETWAKRKEGLEYPFRPSEMRQLKNLKRNFPEWQIMSLWDEYIKSEDDWIKKTGYSINGFLACIVWLVDIPGWKARAKQYEANLAPYPVDIEKI